MTRSSLLLAFAGSVVAAFALGTVSGPLWTPGDAPEVAGAAVSPGHSAAAGGASVSAGSEARDPDRSVALAPTTGRDDGASVLPRGTLSSVPPDVDDLPPLDRLPPHLADPHFPALTGDEMEREQLRREALEDFRASAKQAGLPATEVEAAISAAEDEIERINSVDVGAGPGAPAADEQAADLARSLREAGLPEAEISQMVEQIVRSTDQPPEELGPAPPPGGLGR